MKKVKEVIFFILPAYAWVPIIVALVLNFSGYIGLQKLIPLERCRDLSLPIDDWIPFVPWFIYIYLLAFVQWVVGFVLCGRESKEVCYRYLSAEAYAKMMTILCFILIPATLVRPEVVGHSFAEELVRITYATDAPKNLFPSIHCLESWFCFRAALAQKKTGSWYVWVSGIFTALVFASIVFVKQHLFIDMIGAVLVYEIGFQIAKKHDLSRVYTSIECALGRLVKRS